MLTCIFVYSLSLYILNVYKHDQQKTVVYESDHFKMEKVLKKERKKETFYCHSWFKCCTEKILAWWPIFFSAYFIPV